MTFPNSFIPLSHLIKDKEGQFRWFDGNEAYFLNFNKGDPNGKRKENCVVSSDKTWHDVPCNFKNWKTYYAVPLCQFTHTGMLTKYKIIIKMI